MHNISGVFDDSHGTHIIEVHIKRQFNITYQRNIYLFDKLYYQISIAHPERVFGTSENNLAQSSESNACYGPIAS